MTVAPSIPAHQDNGNRTARLPLVLMLVFGMMLSLIHCAGCDLHYSNDGPAIVVAMQDHGTDSDLPEQQLPPHCGPCLSHIATHRITTTVWPTDAIPVAPFFEHAQAVSGLSGLPLFKPPRA
jgi:hypothetical protein